MSDHVELRHDGNETSIHYTLDEMTFTNCMDAVRHMAKRWPNFSPEAALRYIRGLPCVQRTVGQPGYGTTNDRPMPTILKQLGFLNMLTDCKSDNGVYRPTLYTIFDNHLLYIVAGTGEDGWGMPQEGPEEHGVRVTEPFRLYVHKADCNRGDNLQTIFEVTEKV